MFDTSPRGARWRRRASLQGVGVSALLLLAAAMTAAPSAQGAASFTKGPYIQSLGQTGVTIKVALSEAAPVSIEITGPEGPVSFSTPPSAREASRFQVVRVDGLQPATSYGYVAVAGDARSEPGRFTTAPPDDRPFRFILYGDSRSDHAAHAAVVRAIEATPSDFLLHTGDMVQRGNVADDWQMFFDVERALLRDRCVFAAVGNHELTAPDPAGQMAFVRYFGRAPAEPEPSGSDAPLATTTPLYGSFRWSNTRFFLLNAMDTWTGEDRRWLREELERSDNEPGLVHRIAALHHGPFSSGPHGANKRFVDGGAVGLLRDHRVSLLVAGHDHMYERGEGQGMKYIISGGAGAPLYSRKSAARETQVFEAVHHFVEVAVDGEVVQTIARRASGGIIERCSFRGAGSWSCGAGESGAELGGRAPLPAPSTVSSCGCEVVGGGSSRGGGPPGWSLWASLSVGASLAFVWRSGRGRGGGVLTCSARPIVSIGAAGSRNA